MIDKLPAVNEAVAADTIGTAELIIDANSVGDPSRFVSLRELEQGLSSIRAPTDAGRVSLLVRRGRGGRREVLDEATLSIEDGVPGDAWGHSAKKDLDAQIAVMQTEVAKLIANGQRLTLFGDSLFLDLDLSAANLPAGSRVKAGEAVLEVTPMPHNGCSKFQARFGKDALRFVAMKELRHRNLRGIYLRVVEPGIVRTGDAVRVVARSKAP